MIHLLHDLYIWQRVSKTVFSSPNSVIYSNKCNSCKIDLHWDYIMMFIFQDSLIRTACRSWGFSHQSVRYIEARHTINDLNLNKVSKYLMYYHVWSISILAHVERQGSTTQSVVPKHAHRVSIVQRDFAPPSQNVSPGTGQGELTNAVWLNGYSKSVLGIQLLGLHMSSREVVLQDLYPLQIPCWEDTIDKQRVTTLPYDCLPVYWLGR